MTTKPFRLLPVLGLGAALAALPVSARQAHGSAPAPAAQEAGHAPAPGHEAQKADAHAEPPKAHGAEGGADHGAPAGGHGEQAHHGPVIKLFGKELGAGAQAAIRVFNFLVFAGGLFLLLKGALSAAFKARTREVEERLAQAETDRLEGEAQLRNLEARMAGLQAELDGILSKAEADAEAEKARILEAARGEAAQITAQAQADITAHQRAAEAELRALVVELAVEGAEQRLKAQLQGPSASNAVDRAIASVGASTGGLQ